jgi:hypothetical protein
MSIPNSIVKRDKIWFKDVSQLYRLDRVSEFFPNIDHTIEERLNSIARLGLYAGILLAVYKRDYRQLIWSLLCLALTAVIYKTKIKEDMSGEVEELKQKKPTLNNPFMNPNITDYGVPQTSQVPNYSQDTKDAETTRAQIEDKFNYNLYKSIDDVYDKNNSQRQFYTVPNTDIPSDQVKFLEFLYGDMAKNCKSDTTMCEPYSDLRSNPFIFPNPKDNPTVSGTALPK